MRKRRSTARTVFWTAAIVAALVAVRVGFSPRPAAPHVIRLSPADVVRVRAALAASAVDRPALVAALAPKRVLLVGESHFEEEPGAWLCALLEQLRAADGRRAILLLELPGRGGPDLARFLATGDSSALRAAFGWGALPYQKIVRWARAHPEAVAGVVAIDENPWHSGVMRLLLTDTRNATMAHAVASAARVNAGERVVVFGGRLHMMKSGRYLYDSDTRRPIGERLPSLGVPRSETAVVWLFAGPPPVGGAWGSPGAVALAGPAGALAVTEVYETRIFGTTRFSDLADYAVYLGPATPIQDK